MSESVAIIGMPCAGKSSVGKIVAERLGATFIDTDEFIELSAGMTVGEIFERYGESRFRELEIEAVRAATEVSGAVIAVGGGAVLRKENIDALKSSKTVYLRVSAEEVIRNLSGVDRPLLRGDAAGKVQRMMDEREGLYERAACVTVDADGLTLKQAAQAVIEALE